MAQGELPLEGDDEAERLYRKDEAALFDALDRVMDERGLSEHDLVPMLIAVAYHYRSIAYVAETAKPSETGLRLDLDRMKKLVDEMHRGYRKSADDVIAEIAEAMAAPEAEAIAAPEVVKPTGVFSGGSLRSGQDD